MFIKTFKYLNQTFILQTINQFIILRIQLFSNYPYHLLV